MYDFLRVQEAIHTVIVTVQGTDSG